MTKKSLLKYFQSKDLCVLSTCNLKNKPQSAVMCLVTGDDFNLYLFTGKTTRKYYNLEDNKKVAVVVGGLNGDPSAQINGLARILTGGQAKLASDLITKKHSDWKDYFSPNTRFIRIIPKLVHYSDFSKNIFQEFLF